MTNPNINRKRREDGEREEGRRGKKKSNRNRETDQIVSWIGYIIK